MNTNGRTDTKKEIFLKQFVQKFKIIKNSQRRSELAAMSYINIV